MQAVASPPTSSLDPSALLSEPQIGISLQDTGVASSTHNPSPNKQLPSLGQPAAYAGPDAHRDSSTGTKRSSHQRSQDGLSDAPITNSMGHPDNRQKMAGGSENSLGTMGAEVSEAPGATSSKDTAGDGQPEEQAAGKLDDGNREAESKDTQSEKPAWSELKTKAGKERKRLPLACIACRRKKIRCSGEKPACKHCVRSRIPCVYKVTTRKAAPRTDYMTMLDKRLKRMEERVIRVIPDADPEKMASIGRASIKGPAQSTPKSAGPKKRPADEAFASEIEEWANSDSKVENARPSQGSDQSENGLLKDGAEFLPSKEIQEHLAEIFFDFVYGQVYHLLHKPSFMRKLKVGNVPPVLTLAVCAISARFSLHPEINTEPAFLRGEQWAKPARDIALKRYDEPNITILIVLLIMGLHEFGTCQGGRSWMLGGMAMRMAHALQLHRELDHDPLGRKKDKSSELSFTDREIRRRTMWACFIMDRFNSSGTERPMMVNDLNIEIQLPIKESNFRMEIPGPTETLDGKVPNPVSQDTGQVSDPQLNMDVAAFIVRAIAIWGRVIRYLNLGGKERDPYPMWDTRSRHCELKRQSDEFLEKLPMRLRFSKDNLHNFAAEKVANQFLLLHLTHYQTLLFLHRFAIPTSPTQKLQADIPNDFRNKAGRIAIDSANHISNILNDSLSYKLTAPFAGYCAFVSSTIHVSCIHARSQQLKSSSNRHLASNIKFLTSMKKYWGIFYQMVENLRSIYQQYAKFSLHGRNGGQDQNVTETGVFEYGNWFNTYPHGVSSTDYQEPAVSESETPGNDAALSQKSDLQTVEEFFSTLTPSSARRKSRKQDGSFSSSGQAHSVAPGLKLQTGGRTQHHNHPAPRSDPSAPNVNLGSRPVNEQRTNSFDAVNFSGQHVYPQQNSPFDSPLTPQQSHLPRQQQQPPTPSSATDPTGFDSSMFTNMPVSMTEMDRQFVFDAYAADPNNAGMIWDFGIGDPTGAGDMNMNSPIAQMGPLGGVSGPTGTPAQVMQGTYGDASSAWFMPFNLAPPDVGSGADFDTRSGFGN